MHTDIKIYHNDGTIEYPYDDGDGPEVEFPQYSKNGYTLKIDKWGYYLLNEDTGDLIAMLKVEEYIPYLNITKEDLVVIGLKWGHICKLY